PSRKGRIADRLRIAQAPFSFFGQSADLFRTALKLHTKTAPETPARAPRRPLQSTAAATLHVQPAQAASRRAASDSGLAAPRLARGETNSAVQADALAVDVDVLGQVQGQGGVVGRRAEAAGEGDGGGQAVLNLLVHAGHH